MSSIKLFFQRLTLSLIIILLSFNLTNYSKSVQAQLDGQRNITAKTEQLIFVQPELTNRGAPGRRTGGGRRGDNQA
ncbi:hypothetical protein H6S82_26650, partial [Planktothrix sp. FACHB-1355]